jgi:hypothetical protein
MLAYASATLLQGGEERTLYAGDQTEGRKSGIGASILAVSRREMNWPVSAREIKR